VREDFFPSFDKDLQSFRDLRVRFCKNPLIGYLNINSLRNKISDLSVLISFLQLDYFVLSETKLDSSFPSSQFELNEYEVRGRRDRDKHGGGLIEYVKKGLICQRLKGFETFVSESICSEITISNKKWFCMSIYRPPNYTNLSTFFDEVNFSLSKASTKYDNFIVMGDFNIDINKPGIEYEKLDDFCTLFNLRNLINSETCITNNHKSTIDFNSHKQTSLLS